MGLATLLITATLFASSSDLPYASSPDSIITAPAEPITRPTFIADIDQRFFFFRSSLGGVAKQRSMSIWGIRAGMLFPGNFKAGVGYYIGQQLFSRPGLVPEPYTRLTRRISYVTTYFEPYLFRRKFWELSTPIEVGFGSVRYDSFNYPTRAENRRRGYFVPTGAAVSLSLKFPELRHLRPLRWFGVNFMGGYRLAPHREFTDDQGGYNGFFYSISPAFFLDRFLKDARTWQKSRKKK